MIKIDNSVFYISFGGATYIFGTDGKTLKHIYFGRRVEPEDDMAELGGLPDIPAFVAPVVERNGVAVDARFVFESAEVVRDDSGEQSSHDDKTLVVRLRDDVNALRTELYYTPFPRGGIAVSAAVFNDGSEPITVRAMTLPFSAVGEYDAINIGSDGKIFRTVHGTTPSAAQSVFGFGAAVGQFATETSGDAYGFLYAYFDGSVVVEQKDGAMRTVCRDGAQLPAAVEPNGKYTSAKVIAVYSENGVGGMSRIFHDILRERLHCDVHTRRKTVLFVPLMPKEKTKDCARAAYELGCDILAVNGDEYDDELLAEMAQACKGVGIGMGLRLKYGSHCINSCGNIAADSSDLLSIIKSNGIEYVLLDIPQPERDVRGVFEVGRTLEAAMPELKVEWGIVPQQQRYAATLCYPLCVMRNIISPQASGELKRSFDCATLGGLGYEFDPTAIDVELKRAVRAQILSYQDDAATIMLGDLYRTEFKGGGNCRIAVTKDKSKAYAVCVAAKNCGARIKFDGLDKHNLYHVRELGKTFSGAALISRGIAVSSLVGDAEASVSLHLRQVADYE